MKNGEQCLCGSAYPGAVRNGFTHTSGACYRTPHRLATIVNGEWVVPFPCVTCYSPVGCVATCPGPRANS